MNELETSLQSLKNTSEYQKGEGLYKIHLIGSHGCGKTTLAHSVVGLLIKHNLENVRKITEISERYTDMGLPMNEATTLNVQLGLLYEQFSQELLRREMGHHLVTDRSWDNYIYLENKFGEGDYSGILPIVDAGVTLFRTFAPASHTFLVPASEEGLIANGTRSVDASFQRVIEDKLLSYISENEIPVIYLPGLPSKEKNGWLSLIERTIFEGNYTEPDPDPELLDRYLTENPGLDI
jgi:energy-coupling factor transporter ATP-binding protein EcfA2